MTTVARIALLADLRSAGVPASISSRTGWVTEGFDVEIGPCQIDLVVGQFTGIDADELADVFRPDLQVEKGHQTIARADRVRDAT